MGPVAIAEVIEGTWEEILRQSGKLYGHRLRVEILLEEGEGARSGKKIVKGMFPQLAQLTDEDIKSAEFRGDADDEPNRGE